MTGPTMTVNCADYYRMREQNERMRKEIVELQNQRDAALDDARRYRWLRNEVRSHRPMASVVWKRGFNRDSSEWSNTFSADSLDQHIDAALAEVKHGN